MAETPFRIADLYGSYPKPIAWDQVQNGDILVMKYTDGDEIQFDTLVLMEKKGLGGQFCRLSAIRGGALADGASGIQLSAEDVDLYYCGNLRKEIRD